LLIFERGQVAVRIHGQNQQVEKRLLLDCGKTGQIDVYAVTIPDFAGI
jgi:hypothetical protein